MDTSFQSIKSRLAPMLVCSVRACSLGCLVRELSYKDSSEFLLCGFPVHMCTGMCVQMHVHNFGCADLPAFTSFPTHCLSKLVTKWLSCLSSHSTGTHNHIQPGSHWICIHVLIPSHYGLLLTEPLSQPQSLTPFFLVVFCTTVMHCLIAEINHMECLVRKFWHFFQ